MQTLVTFCWSQLFTLSDMIHKWCPNTLLPECFINPTCTIQTQHISCN